MTQPLDLPPIVILACRVFQDLFERHFPAGSVRQTIFLDYGLHSQPRNLAKAVQQQLDALVEPSLVVLGYGLCGNGLHGIQARQHTLLIPRADDCISVFLGSYANYQRQFSDNPGTYYLTKGWLEAGSNPLQEYTKYVQKYGQQQADWLIENMYHNYKRIAFVAHTQEDLDKYRPQALEVAHFCERFGMRYEEVLGAPAYFEQLVEASHNPEQAGGDFLVIKPGGELRQDLFLRIQD